MLYKDTGQKKSMFFGFYLQEKEKNPVIALHQRKEMSFNNAGKCKYDEVEIFKTSVYQY